MGGCSMRVKHDHLTFNIKHSTFLVLPPSLCDNPIREGTGGQAQTSRTTTNLLQIHLLSPPPSPRRHPSLLPLELSAWEHRADRGVAVGFAEESEAARAGDRAHPRRCRLR